jgi:succinoglycan biosynthesis protein ExoL
MHDIKYHLIENKPEVGGQYIKSLTKIKGDNSKIRIGYFGVLRCLRSWEILKNLAQNYSDKFDLYIRGLAVEPVTIESECNEMGNVKYEGPYLVPDDLSSMYNQVDIVWACYPYQGSKVGNWCWAKTTRFYEACLFKKPMITQAKTQDALFISKYNIGIKLDLSDINKSVNQLIQLSKSDINQMTNNFQDVPIEVYTYGDEHEKLIKILKGELL